MQSAQHLTLKGMAVQVTAPALGAAAAMMKRRRPRPGGSKMALMRPMVLRDNCAQPLALGDSKAGLFLRAPSPHC